MDRCDSGASSADNPRTVLSDIADRAAVLPSALTNTSMGFASTHPAFILLLLRTFHFIRDDKKIFYL